MSKNSLKRGSKSGKTRMSAAFEHWSRPRLQDSRTSFAGMSNTIIKASKKTIFKQLKMAFVVRGLGWKTGEGGLFFDQFRVVFTGIQFNDLAGLRINDPFSNVDDMVADAFQLTTDDQVDVRGF